VTDYKQVEQALRESEETLRLALTAAQTVVWDMDLQTYQVVCSTNALDVWGLHEGTGEEFFALIHPDDRQQVMPSGPTGKFGRTVLRTGVSGNLSRRRCALDQQSGASLSG
jgi:PAS domain-containing protein